MADNTKTPSQSTILFASLPPEIAVIINDVIHAIYLNLGWCQASKSLLAEILSRIAEADYFEQSHDDFCAALWPYLDKKRRREKISRWVAKLRVDMEMSQFNPIFIPKQKVTRTSDGGFKGHPTVYRIGHFWKLFRYVQDNARDIDLFSFPVNKRRAQVRVFVSEWLNEAGARKINREKIEKEKSAKSQKEKSASLPCRCDCASCVLCALKGANVSEAAGVMKPPRLITRSDVGARMEAYFEGLFECGQDWAELGFDTADFWRKCGGAMNDLDQRLADAIKRHNAPGLKLVGGQPK